MDDIPGARQEIHVMLVIFYPGMYLIQSHMHITES